MLCSSQVWPRGSRARVGTNLFTAGAFRRAFALGCVLSTACGGYDDAIFDSPRWSLSVTVDEAAEELVIDAVFATVHDNDFVHMSIRKEGYDNRFRDLSEDGVDWTRPNLWFGQMHPDTYLEGGMYPGEGDYTRPPRSFRDYRYRLSLAPTRRTNWPDVRGSPFNYTTRGYQAYDDHRGHPGFGPGEYEVELYAWYTGSPDDRHPAANDDATKVQYVHYERPIVRARFRVQ